MTTKMVDLPWHDGTTRTVPEGTVYEADNSFVFVARDGGYSIAADPEKPFGSRIYQHYDKSTAVRIFGELPEPSVKVEVPTGIGAIVSFASLPDIPGYVLTRDGWRGLSLSNPYDTEKIANRLRNGARVLYEGVENG